MKVGGEDKRYMKQNIKGIKDSDKEILRALHSFQRIERKKTKNSFFPSFGNVFFFTCSFFEIRDWFEKVGRGAKSRWSTHLHHPSPRVGYAALPDSRHYLLLIPLFSLHLPLGKNLALQTHH